MEKNDSFSRKTAIRMILFAAVVISAACLFACQPNEPTHVHAFVTQETTATCEAPGRVTEVCETCGEVRSDTEIAATGHAYGEWVTLTESTLFTDGEKQRVCSICGAVENGVIESPTHNMPHVNFCGSLEGIGKDKEVMVILEYTSPELSFSSYATMEWQGASSVYYPKKNFTLRLYKDETLDKKNKINVGWGEESKYCLKANFVDATSARNIVTANLWTEMISTRKGVPAQLAASPCGGAVDGFPVILLHDGEFYGLYTWNVPKDEWMFNLGKKDTGAVLMAENWEDTGKWKATADPDKDDWEIKFESDDMKNKALARMNEAIRFVLDASDDDFKREINGYIDVDSVIDYMILMYVSCATDNYSKNAVYVTYDGLKFYMSPYDLDATWFMRWDGLAFYKENYFLPRVSTNGQYFRPEVDNELFYRIGELYPDLIAARYFDLRKEILTPEHIMSKFRAFTKQIPGELYETDFEKWPDIPSQEKNTVGRTSLLVKKRMLLLDDIMSHFCQ